MDSIFLVLQQCSILIGINKVVSNLIEKKCILTQKKQTQETSQWRHRVSGK